MVCTFVSLGSSMNEISVSLENCYGINKLSEVFSFTNPKVAKAYAVYAPNGLMKTSFARTFIALSRNETPKEERFNRTPVCSVLIDGQAVEPETLYVLNSEIDVNQNTDSVSNILINHESKSAYDSLFSDIKKSNDLLINQIQKSTKIKKNDVESELCKTLNCSTLYEAILECFRINSIKNYAVYPYSEIFDQKVLSILRDKNFLDNAELFNQRYLELFEESSKLYQLGVFNPQKADVTISSLKNNGFFDIGHKVHLNGDDNSIDHDEFKSKLDLINSKIDSDDSLKKIRVNLSKNAQTQSLFSLLETLNSDDTQFFIHSVKPSNINEFRKSLLASYVANCSEAENYVKVFASNKESMEAIEAEAAKEAPSWSRAVELFNNRFVDMPFKLSLFNPVDAALGKEQAKLKFTFQDGQDYVDCTKEQIKALSQGEKRALYLLNFIFDVEARKLENKKTIFIIDDVADSFDYKNKHAIVQYLKDLSLVPNFYQIVLTHNFDFFRTIADIYINRTNCLMANRNGTSINLTKADGISNYFIGMWKENVSKCDTILCATIPFTRNLLEYTKGVDDADYLKLTSMLHWKEGTNKISVGDYFAIYNRLFDKQLPEDRDDLYHDLLISGAIYICSKPQHNGLNLEDKVLLSMAIRMKAEMFLLDQIRHKKGEFSYWPTYNNQFGKLQGEYQKLVGNTQVLRTLEKVSITVSSNIHLNSFMYEPILDLTI